MSEETHDAAGTAGLTARKLRVPGEATIAEVSLGAVRHNLSELCRAAGRTPAGILAAVKADAYGHGAVAVGKMLEAAGVAMLGVARLEEGIELRDAGVRAPILVLSGLPYLRRDPRALEGRVRDLIEHDLIPVLFDGDIASSIDACVGRLGGGPLPFHLKVDTGMNRIGVSMRALPETASILAGCKHLQLTGALTHLAHADGLDEDARAFSEEQLRQFREAASFLRILSAGRLTLHAANSAAALSGLGLDLDLLRPGKALYGAYPRPQDRLTVELRPALKLATTVLCVKDIEAGAPVSYARTFIAQRRTRIATLAIGFGDGFPRAASAPVLIRGKRVPVVGRVCMDMVMVDVTDAPGVEPGDEAVVIGSQADGHGVLETISAQEIADRTGTIFSHVLTSISKRVPRIYRI